MKPSWYHASPIVPASSGCSIFGGEKSRAFHDFFRPNLCFGITLKQKNSSLCKNFCWLSKSSWTNVMSWLNQWVCKMQWLGSCQVGCFSHLHLSMVDLQIGSEDLSIRSWMKDHREVLEEFWPTPKLFCWKHTFIYALCILSSLRHYYLDIIWHNINFWFWFWFQLSSSMVQHFVSQQNIHHDLNHCFFDYYYHYHHYLISNYSSFNYYDAHLINDEWIVTIINKDTPICMMRVVRCPFSI